MVIDAEQSLCLTPAKVFEVVGKRVRVQLGSDEPWALLALAFPYSPMPGDLVLVIGSQESWYVIGVIEGRGDTIVMAPASIRFFAPYGQIEFTAGEGIRLRSRTIKLVAESFSVLARIMSEKCQHFLSWVEDDISVRCRRMKTRVEASYRVIAGKILQSAREDVKIDGRKIDLG